MQKAIKKDVVYRTEISFTEEDLKNILRPYVGKSITFINGIDVSGVVAVIQETARIEMLIDVEPK